MAKTKSTTKTKTLDELLDAVHKATKLKSSLSVASDVVELYKVKHLPTGLPALDEILGGGLPRGLITEAFGPWSGGKSFLALKAAAATQQAGGIAAWLDTEASFSPGLAKAVGVDLDRLLLKTPEDGDLAVEILLALAEEGPDLIVLDSATSLAPKKLLESDISDGGYPAGVRLWNAALIRLKPKLFGGPTAFYFCNQIRDNVGVVYGPSTTEPMGWRSKHDAALRLEVRRKEWIKQGDKRVGQVSLVRVHKSKVDGVVPYAETTFDIPFVELRDEYTAEPV